MIQIRCQICNAVTVLDASEKTRIREELARLGPGAVRIWECACHRYQIVLALRERTERRAA
jgi:hypothetical protein